MLLHETAMLDVVLYICTRVIARPCAVHARHALCVVALTDAHLVPPLGHARHHAHGS